MTRSYQTTDSAFSDGAVCAASPTTQPASADTSDIATLTFPPTVWLLDEVPCPGYDAFVAETAGSSLYATLDWRDALAQRHAGTPLYLLALCGDAIVGVLPLFGVTQPNGQRELLSLPATPSAGPLTNDDSVRWLLESRALMLAGFRGCESVRIRQYVPWNEEIRIAGDYAWLRLPLHLFGDADARNGGLRGELPDWLSRLRVQWDGQANLAAWCDALLLPENRGPTCWLSHAQTLHVLPTAASLTRQNASDFPLSELARLCATRQMHWIEIRVSLEMPLRDRLGPLAEVAHVSIETALSHGEDSLDAWHPTADQC